MKRARYNYLLIGSLLVVILVTLSSVLGLEIAASANSSLSGSNSLVYLPIVVAPGGTPSGEMVLVPAGEFQMGCDESNPNESCKSSELPLHTVHLDTYQIHKYEVTNDQYARFLNERDSNICSGNQCVDLESSSSHIALQSGQYVVENDFEDHPVIEVSWYGGNSFCTESGGRLPSEAEWEKAARGSNDTRMYPWGNQPADCNRAYYNSCGSGTEPVGSFPSGASPYGALDMAGNVWEMVNDWYDSDYYDVAPYANPPGPASATRKVIRGGSSFNDSDLIGVARRAAGSPTDTIFVIGFRCAYQ